MLGFPFLRFRFVDGDPFGFPGCLLLNSNRSIGWLFVIDPLFQGSNWYLFIDDAFLNGWH